MSFAQSPKPAIPKVRRVRVYTRLSLAVRRQLHAYCAATGRSERAVIENAVVRYLANPTKEASSVGSLDRLAQTMDEDRRVRDGQRRDLELLSQAFGQFLRLWAIVHSPTLADLAPSRASEQLSKQRRSGEALYKHLLGKVAHQWLRGHRFAHELPGLDESPPEREDEP
jgi:hypothetical protein